MVGIVVYSARSYLAVSSGFAIPCICTSCTLEKHSTFFQRTIALEVMEVSIACGRLSFAYVFCDQYNLVDHHPNVWNTYPRAVWRATYRERIVRTSLDDLVAESTFVSWCWDNRSVRRRDYV